MKLSNFGTEIIISEKLYHNEIKRVSTETEEQEDEQESLMDRSRPSQRVFLYFEDASEYIQQAPEIIRELVSRKCIPRGSQTADIYSLGMVLYQILFRVQPFHERGKSITSKKIDWV